MTGSCFNNIILILLFITKPNLVQKIFRWPFFSISKTLMLQDTDVGSLQYHAQVYQRVFNKFSSFCFIYVVTMILYIVAHKCYIEKKDLRQSCIVEFKQ